VNDGLELDQRTIQALLEAFDASDWVEMTVTIGNDRLYVSRRGRDPGSAAEPPPPQAPPKPAPAPAQPAPAPVTPQTLIGTVVESPSVGLFWRAPAPGAPPFADVGTRVSPGDTLAIVEVMKLMNHIVAPSAGKVSSVLAENGARVEYGQPLFTIDPES
jgi:acetyl-CoA carboxylase biotin carboxyl carrier protein